MSEQVGFVEVADPAQIRVHIGDLSTARFGDWLDALGYERARQVSVGNAQFLGILTQQLGVLPEAALDVAQQLLDAQLVCPLGGDYQRIESGQCSDMAIHSLARCTGAYNGQQTMLLRHSTGCVDWSAGHSVSRSTCAHRARGHAARRA